MYLLVIFILYDLALQSNKKGKQTNLAQDLDQTRLVFWHCILYYIKRRDIGRSVIQYLFCWSIHSFSCGTNPRRGRNWWFTSCSDSTRRGISWLLRIISRLRWSEPYRRPQLSRIIKMEQPCAAQTHQCVRMMAKAKRWWQPGTIQPSDPRHPSIGRANLKWVGEMSVSGSSSANFRM